MPPPNFCLEIGFLWHKFESKIGDEIAKNNVIENLGIFTFLLHHMQLCGRS